MQSLNQVQLLSCTNFQLKQKQKVGVKSNLSNSKAMSVPSFKGDHLAALSSMGKAQVLMSKSKKQNIHFKGNNFHRNVNMHKDNVHFGMEPLTIAGWLYKGVKAYKTGLDTSEKITFRQYAAKVIGNVRGIEGYVIKSERYSMPICPDNFFKVNLLSHHLLNFNIIN